MEIEISEKPENLKGLFYGIIFVVLVTIFSYSVLDMSVVYAMLLLVVGAGIVVGLFGVFTHFEKYAGKQAISFGDDAMVWGRYIAPNKFKPLLKPISYKSINKICIKNRYFRWYYKRNRTTGSLLISLKSVLMDENERKRREKILEELVKRVKKANPEVEIVDKRKRW